MGKIYANLKDLINGKNGWKVLDENKRFNMEDLMIRGSTWDSIWIRVVGNEQEAMEYLYDIMNLEKRFIPFMIESSISKRMRVFRDGKIIPEDGGYFEIYATKNFITINEYNKLGEQQDDIVMSWESYEVMKEYLEELKMKMRPDDNE